jgi:dTDP-4-dehydrorhamnose reductase
MSKKVLIIGGDGQLGSYLSRSLTQFDMEIVATTRKTKGLSSNSIFLDLIDPTNSLANIPENIDYALICAAETSIEKCNSYPKETSRINVHGVQILTEFFNRKKIPILFFSTNLVFDGKAPYERKDSLRTPFTEYGQQKKMAENLILDGTGDATILRLSKVISPNMLLLKNWCADLLGGKVIHPFYDSVMAPISIDLVAKLVAKIISNRALGIIQASANDDLSYANAATYIANKLGAPSELVQAISYRDRGINYSPQHSTFDDASLLALGIDAPDPLDALSSFLKNLNLRVD